VQEELATDENRPTAQAAQATWRELAYIPARQATHTLAPANEYFPVEHTTHAVDSETIPVEAPYIPAMHLTQLIEATAGWNMPSEHDRQEEEEGAPMATENVPSRQLKHPAEVDVSMYLPAGHFSHVEDPEED
jgi:hypothetical protein